MPAERAAPGAALTLCLAALLACADPPRPVAGDEPLGADGLERVPSRRLAVLYERTDASFAPYSKVRVAFAGVAYRDPPPDRALSGPSGTGANYALTPDQRDRLERDFVATFERELVGSGLYAAAALSGPEVLDVRGRIVDLLVEVPPEIPIPDHSYVGRSGEATLILEVFDSTSGRALLRLADRRVLAQPTGSALYRSGPVSSASDLRRALTRWARALRDRLGELRERDLAASG